MESGFTDYVLYELRTLIEELNNAQQPSNLPLFEVITARLRAEYERPGYTQYTGFRP